MKKKPTKFNKPRDAYEVDLDDVDDSITGIYHGYTVYHPFKTNENPRLHSITFKLHYFRINRKYFKIAGVKALDEALKQVPLGRMTKVIYEGVITKSLGLPGEHSYRVYHRK